MVTAERIARALDNGSPYAPGRVSEFALARAKRRGHRTSYGVSAAEINARLPRSAHDARTLAVAGFSLEGSKRTITESHNSGWTALSPSVQLAVEAGLIRKVEVVRPRTEREGETALFELTTRGRRALEAERTRLACGGTPFLVSLEERRHAARARLADDGWVPVLLPAATAKDSTLTGGGNELAWSIRRAEFLTFIGERDLLLSLGANGDSAVLEAKPSATWHARARQAIALGLVRRTAPRGIPPVGAGPCGYLELTHTGNGALVRGWDTVHGRSVSGEERRAQLLRKFARAGARRAA